MGAMLGLESIIFFDKLNKTPLISSFESSINSNRILMISRALSINSFAPDLLSVLKSSNFCWISTLNNLKIHFFHFFYLNSISY